MGISMSGDCVPASGVTPLHVMLCVVHYAVRMAAVSITSHSWVGVIEVGAGGVSWAMEAADK